MMSDPNMDTRTWVKEQRERYDRLFALLQQAEGHDLSPERKQRIQRSLSRLSELERLEAGVSTLVT